MLYRIKNPQVIHFLYSNDLQAILFRYLNDNCDIVTNYDYIVYLLQLLATISLPSSHPPFDVRYFLHCGDPDIEDVAVKVDAHWNRNSIVCNKNPHMLNIKYGQRMCFCVEHLLCQIHNFFILK